MRANHAHRYHRPEPAPPPAAATLTPNDQLANAIAAHLVAVMPRTSDEQLTAAARMLRARDLSGVEYARAVACVEAYAAEEMFFNLATFRAAFDAAFRAPARAVVKTDEMFAKWREDRDRIAAEQRQIDEELAGRSAHELCRIRGEIADEIERRPPDKSNSERVDQQRQDNQVEAAIVRRSDPTRPGLARALIYERLTNGAIA